MVRGVDQEIEERTQWMTASGAKTVPERRVVQTLVTNPDTAGRAAWRERKAADASIRLPPDFAPFEQDEIKKRSRDDNALSANFPQIAKIAADNNVEAVVAPASSATYNHHKQGLTVYLWGSMMDVNAAKATVGEWIKDVYGKDPKKRDKWAKIPSLTDEEKKIRYRNLEIQNQLLEFRKLPPQDVRFSSLASFTWPTELIKPQDVLGMHYEALDAIRTEQKCHIVCDRESTTFICLGNSDPLVKQALLRLRSTYFQVVAKQVDAQTYYFVAPQTERSRSQVEMIRHNTTDIVIPGKEAYRRPIPDSRSQFESHFPDPEEARDMTMKDMRGIVLKSLAALRYYQGNITMRVRFGQFILSKWKNLKGLETMSRDEFDMMMNDPNVQGEVGKTSVAFGSLITEKSIEERQFPPQRIFQSLLVTGDAIKPTIAATFLVKDCTANSTLRLDIEFSPTADGRFMDCIAQKWSRVAQEDGELTRLLDVVHMDLDDNIAWNLEIMAGSSIDLNRTPGLGKFADSINIPKAPAKHEQLLLDFKPEPSLRILAIQQRKVYKCRFHGSDYTCDIALVCDFKVENVGSLLAPSFSTTKPYWSVSVSNDVWAAKFSENAHTRVGDAVKWQADAQTFFPRNEGINDKGKGKKIDGFRDLMTRLGEVESMFAGFGE